MASNKLEATLREGIEAARRGDKLAARRLLQQVLQQDRGNETALMWMASVVDTLPERRAYLEQVLRINPGNDRAREALERLGGSAPARTPAPKNTSGATPKPAPAPSRSKRGSNPYFLAAGAIAGVMLLVVVVFLFTQSGAPPEAAVAVEPTSAVQVDGLATVRPTVTRTPVPPTPLPVVIVTLDRTQSSLPPTFTHTPSPEPTATFTPSATPIPLSSYPIVFAAVPPQTFLPSLFTGQADGAGIADVGDEDGYFDIALSPDGASIAFVRDIAPADSGERDWQLFTAPVTNPTDVNRITNIESAGIEHPAWSSDGRSIVYAANVDGDYDLFRVPSNPDGSAEPVALTDNVAYDSYPAFAPDGDTLLFVSDINTPGFTRMFRLTAEGVLSTFSNVTGAITSPVYSPDGTRVAYIQRQSGDPDLFVIGADGQRPFQLTIDDTADDRSPAWSRDGRWIAFASNRNGNRFLWYFVNTDTSVVVPLNDLAEAQSIAFLPEQGG